MWWVMAGLDLELSPVPQAKDASTAAHAGYVARECDVVHDEHVWEGSHYKTLHRVDSDTKTVSYDQIHLCTG